MKLKWWHEKNRKSKNKKKMRSKKMDWYIWRMFVMSIIDEIIAFFFVSCLHESISVLFFFLFSLVRRKNETRRRKHRKKRNNVGNHHSNCRLRVWKWKTQYFIWLLLVASTKAHAMKDERHRHERHEQKLDTLYLSCSV